MPSQRVYLFKEALGKDRSLLGGKGYGVVEMVSIGLPVPPGLIITTDVCKEYYANNSTVPTDLFDEVTKQVRQVELQIGRNLGNIDRPLLVSVRSGAPLSMPGMMDTILNLGLNDRLVDSLAKLTGNTRYAYDSYRRLLQMFGKIVLGIQADLFEKELEHARQGENVKMDIELSPETLHGIVRKFQEIIRHETGREFPQEPLVQLRLAIEAVLKSWNNPRAQEYRKYYKISDSIGTAVIIQSMVFGNSGSNSGSGVGFTRNPSTGEKILFGEYLPNSQGEDVVSGTRTPISLTNLDSTMKNQIVDVASKLESHFRDMQDFEFTVDNSKLYMLQTRNGKRTAQAAVKIAVDMVNEGLIKIEDALGRIDPKEIDQLLHPRLDPNYTGSPIAKGLDASPGAVSGKVVFNTQETAERGNQGEQIILVRPETTPEDIAGIIAARGVLTSRGGMTSHAAVVARGMGKPAVVGCGEIEISSDMQSFVGKNGVLVKRDEVITIDGSSGNVFKGRVPTVEPEVTIEFSKLLEYADKIRRLGVWANTDTPDGATKAVKFGAQGIGLCRTERMFNEPDRLPIVREMILSRDLESRDRALSRLRPFQLEDFIAIFRTMKGRPVVVRLLDLPLHEFLPGTEQLIHEIDTMKLEHVGTERVHQRETMLERVEQLAEHNPMLGHRGIRLGVTFPEIYKMQTQVILEAALRILKEEGEAVRVKIMLPLVSTASEMELLRRVIDNAAEELFTEKGMRTPYEVGTMIETPRAALVADQIAKYADFFSFGTNDLTQTVFAFSRDDAESKFLGNYLQKGLLKTSPFESIDADGVGRLVKIAVDDGRKTNRKLEVGVCGELGGDPKSVHFFHEAGLDYVSCSPYRVPIARLAAAQAAVGNTAGSKTV